MYFEIKIEIVARGNNLLFTLFYTGQILGNWMGNINSIVSSIGITKCHQGLQFREGKIYNVSEENPLLVKFVN